jgi:hypothetical protein
MLKDKKVFYYDSKVIRNFNFKDKSRYIIRNKKVLYSFENTMIKWFVSKELFYAKTKWFQTILCN